MGFFDRFRRSAAAQPPVAPPKTIDVVGAKARDEDEEKNLQTFSN